jgi:hypothetical protein
MTPPSIEASGGGVTGDWRRVGEAAVALARPGAVGG